jgi:DNA-binding Xre family transcriptional regulator
MNRPTKDELNEFVNALQLSIDTKIVGFRHAPDASLIIEFAEDASKDRNLKKFANMIDGFFQQSSRVLRIPNASAVDWQKLTSFLYVTRLTKSNVETISRMGPRYVFLVEKDAAVQPSFTINNIRDAADRLFSIVDERKMTMRTLAEKTGLTQTSLGKFKAGGDIRLSNLIKIANALGVRLKIE